MDFRMRSRIRSVLRKGRTERLPEDPHEAQYHLLPLVIEGKFKAISSLLANSSFDVNQKFRRDGRTLLHQAVSNPDTVNVLLEAGADTNVQDLGGCTPLHIAARNGSTESIQILVNNGADVYKVDFEGLSALHYAALHGKLDLLKAVARVMKKQSVQGVLDVKDFKIRTPLSYAADNGHTEIVEYLLKHGAEVDVPDESGQTSLLRAISRGHEGCVKHLLEHNADIKQRSKDGSTILEILVKNNHIRCLSLLNQPVFDIIKLFTCAEVEYDNVISCIDHINGERNVKRELWDALCEVTFRHVEELLASDFQTKDYLFNKYIRALDHIRRMPDYKELNPGSPRHKTLSGNSSLDRKTIKISAPQNPQILRTYTVAGIMSTNTSITNDALDRVWTMLARHMMICRQYLIETGQSLPSPVNRSRPSSFLKNDPWSLPQETKSSQKTSVEEPHQSPFIRRSSLRKILPDDVTIEGSTMNELEDPVAKFSLHLCSLIEGYHTWCRNTTQFKEFLDFITTHASIIKVFIQRDHQLIFNQLNFLLESPIAMKQFQNIRSAMYKESLENRKSWMYTRLYQKSGVPDETLSSDIKVFNISRDNVFGSSCEQVMGQDATLLQEGIAIKFEGDEGIGAGLRKEWFTLITELITDGNYGLFQLCNEGLNFHPSRYSQVHPDHLSHFEFAGRVMALSIFYKNTIDIHFTKSFYKQILGIPVDYTDVACIDADVANSLQWCLNNDISEEGFTFHIEEENFDNIETIELKPGGAHIEVTEENKHEYVELYSEYKLTNAIKNQIHSFLKGFFEIIPRSYVAVFTPKELELIMCGLPDIDKQDWSDSTTYGDEVSPQTKYWFWEIIEELTQKECAQLLRFFTGYSRVPHGGFSQIGRNVSAGGVKISKLLDVGDEYIPRAQVCFNTLLLPEYSSKEIMEAKLRVVIAHAHEGFELT